MRNFATGLAIAILVFSMGGSAWLLSHALRQARLEGFAAGQMASAEAQRAQEAQRQQRADALNARTQQTILDLQRSHDALVEHYHAMLAEAARSGSASGPCLDTGLVRGLDAIGR